MADILIIEDSFMLHKAYRRMFKKHNLTIVVSGLEALALLEEGKFDIILSDGDLKGQLTGIDVWKWVSINRTDLLNKYLFCSGNVEVCRFCEKNKIPYNDKFDTQALIGMVDSLLEAQS